MKKIIFTICAFLVLASCDKDDVLNQITFPSKTGVKITLKNTSDQVVSGVSVYAYTNEIYTAGGDNTANTNETIVSNSEGKANFNNIEYANTFSNNNAQSYQFSAHYTLNSVAKTKVVPLNLNQGEVKNLTIILD